MRTLPLPFLTLAAVAVFVGGCAETTTMPSTQPLFDGHNPPPQMYHVSVVPDPLADDSGHADPVLKGGPAGAKNMVTANKTSLLKPAGFFRVPDGPSRVVLLVAVRKLRDLKIEIHSKDPAGKAVYSITLSADDQWHEVMLDIDQAKLPAGSAVHDITVFQLGSDKSAELYVRSATLQTR